jgi:hypothetical protein
MGETIGYDFHFDLQARMSDKRNFKLNVSSKPQWGPCIQHTSIHRILRFFRDEEPGIDPADTELKDI